MSMPAVRVFINSAPSICFGLVGRDYTFDGSAFYVLFQKVLGLEQPIGLGFV